MGGKYVPPHLRNKAGSASAVAPSASSSSSRRFPNARFPPASTVSSASSAASADPPTGYRQEQEQLQQQQQQQQRKQGRALSSLQRMSQNNTGNDTSNGTATAGGRFQNLASQDVRTFERSNSNNNSNNNNNSNDRHRRFEKGPSSSLSSLSAAVEAKKKTPKVLFFGDSFIRLFTLVEHADMKVKAFKGGSAVGLSRQHNENRLAVQDDVRRCQQTLQHLVFCFGSVDVHLSYFFKTVIKQESLDVVQVAKDYVAFLATLPQLISNNSNSNSNPNSNELTIHVVGIYPSPLKDENVRESLFLYGVIPEDQTHLVPDKDITMEARQSRVRLFNQTLKECCEQYNININNNNNNSITTDINWSFQYDSVYEDVLDPNTNTLKDSMRDVSQMNIHICWEPTVILWLRKWEWYQAMAPPNFDAFLQQNFEEYLQTKPWATETHVGAHGNLKQAVENDAGPKQYSNSKYKAENAKETSFAADFSIDNV